MLFFSCNIEAIWKGWLLIIMNRDELINRLTVTLNIRKLAPRTKEIYSLWVDRFLSYSGISDSSEISVFMAQDYIEFLLHENYADRTRNQAAYALRQLFEAVLLITLPKNAIPIVRVGRSEKEWFTGEQAITLINKCPNLRLKAAIALAYGCGLRISEIANLQFKNINKASQSITVVESKGSKTRTIPYSPTAALILNQYILSLNYSGFSPDDYIFFDDKKNPQYRLKNCTLANEFKCYIKDFSFALPGHTIHSLRHAFCSELAMRNVSLTYIQKTMGHSTIAATSNYLHFPEGYDTVIPDILQPREENARSK